jgi:hypothetical protein
MCFLDQSEWYGNCIEIYGMLGFSDQALFILALGVFVIAAIMIKTRLKVLGLPSYIWLADVIISGGNAPPCF